jgi:hypothetical protein
LVKIEELRDVGRADYSFRVDKNFRPTLRISIYLTDKKESLRTWTVPLPLTEEEVGHTIAALDKVSSIVAKEEVKKKELARQAILSKLTPEEIKLLTTKPDTTFKYES